MKYIIFSIVEKLNLSKNQSLELRSQRIQAEICNQFANRVHFCSPPEGGHKWAHKTVA